MIPHLVKVLNDTAANLNTISDNLEAHHGQWYYDTTNDDYRFGLADGSLSPRLREIFIGTGTPVRFVGQDTADQLTTFNFGDEFYVDFGTLRFSGVNRSRTITSSDYTLVLADRGRWITVNSSANRKITLPNSSTVDFAIGTNIEVIRQGTGEVEFEVAGGVTLNGNGLTPYKIANRYTAVVLKKVQANEWVVIGNLLTA